MAYVLGYIYSDGTIEDVRKSSRTCYMAISSTDRHIIEDIRKVLSSNHNIYTRKTRFSTFPGGRRYLTSESYILRIGSKLLYDDLINLGLTPRKSLMLKFPEIPDKMLRFFIKGYFDGDGCVMVSTDKGKKQPSIKVIFTSGSSLFLEKLGHILEKTVNTIPKNVISGDHAFQLGFKKYDSLKILKFIYHRLEDTPYLIRKYYIYKRYKDSL